MKTRQSLIAAALLVLALVLPTVALGQVAPAPVPPSITLVAPSLPTAQFQGGAASVISINATSQGSTIASAEYQTYFSDPAGTMVALEVFAQIPVSPVPSPRAGGSARDDDTPAPAGLPAGSVVSLVIFGTVTDVDADGEWTIGDPPIFVYESASTKIQGAPGVGTAVRVVATRTLEPGPIVAEVISQLAGGSLPAAPPTRETAFLFNSTIQSVQEATQSAGIKLGGTVWTIGGVPFRMDDANLPAVVDPGIGLGTGLDPVVTVEFTTPLPTGVSSNTALEIFAQVPDAIPPTLHPSPVFNTEPSPVDVPVGSWKLFVISGVVSAINANGEWRIGNQPIFVYESAATVFGGARRPVVGDGVRIIANRTLAPGPLVAEVITFRAAGPLAAAPAAASSAFLFNGTVQSTGATTWNVGGVNFVVNDANFPAVVDAGLAAGNAVTVEFSFTGPPPPVANLWVSLPLDSSTNLRSATLTPPGIAAQRTGVLFLRATNADQQVTTISVPATLLVAAAAPAAAPASLSAAVASATRVNLSWTDASDNETSFRVERATNTDFTANRQTFTVGADSTSFQDTTAPASTTLFYRVIAVNGAGDSTASNVVSVTTSAAALPSAASGLTATSVVSDRVSLSWTDSTGELGYRVERATGGGGFTLVVTLGANVTTYADSSVAASTTYQYRVVAFNDEGSTSPAGPITVNTPAPPASGAQQQLPPSQEGDALPVVPQATPTPVPTATPVPLPTATPEPQVIPIPKKEGGITAVLRPSEQGKVELEDKTVITVPAEALSTTVQMSARSVPEAELPEAPRGKVRKALEIELFDDKGDKLKSVEIRQPLIIEVPITAEDRAAMGDDPNNIELLRYDEGTRTWIRLNAEVDLVNNVLRARLTHLSLFAVVVPAPVVGPSAGGALPGSSAWLLALLAGVVALTLGLRLLRVARQVASRK